MLVPYDLPSYLISQKKQLKGGAGVVVHRAGRFPTQVQSGIPSDPLSLPGVISEPIVTPEHQQVLSPRGNLKQGSLLVLA